MCRRGPHPRRGDDRGSSPSDGHAGRAVASGPLDRLHASTESSLVTYATVDACTQCVSDLQPAGRPDAVGDRGLATVEIAGQCGDDDLDMLLRRQLATRRLGEKAGSQQLSTICQVVEQHEPVPSKAVESALGLCVRLRAGRKEACEGEGVLAGRISQSCACSRRLQESQAS